MNPAFLHRLLLAGAMFVVAACGEPDQHDDHDHDAAPASRSDGDSSAAARIPGTVRRNLGITFARVERRHVKGTLRVPGSLEFQPSARMACRAATDGRVEYRLRQFDRVEAGQVLFRLHAPEWKRVQAELARIEAAIGTAKAEIAAAVAAVAGQRAKAEALRARIRALGDVQVRRAEVEAELTAEEADIPRLTAEVAVKEARLRGEQAHFEATLTLAAAMTGVDAGKFADPPSGDPSGAAVWRTIETLDTVAAVAGVVSETAVTDGAFVKAGDPILTIVDPTALRFRGLGLQSDLMKFRDGMACAILPPAGAQVSPAESLSARLAVGLIGDADERTFELYAVPSTAAPWARAGVATFLEVILAEGEEAGLAIPMRCLVQDGLERIFYRRDPKDPDRALRVEADLGIDDGRWVEVRSGVREGDEVVLEGAFQLALAGSGASTQGGHMHADGTFHTGEHK